MFFVIVENAGLLPYIRTPTLVYFGGVILSPHIFIGIVQLFSGSECAMKSPESNLTFFLLSKSLFSWIAEQFLL